MWNNIIGQKQVIKKLKSLYRSGRVGHAYLFYGQEGTGKDAAAIEFAKLLNCTNRNSSPLPRSKEEIEACDTCSNCRNISAMRSDFFHFITALPSGKANSSIGSELESLSASEYENYLEQLKTKSADPYHHLRLQGGNNIRIDSIREMINEIYLSAPVRGETFTKVFLISEAEKMRQEAGNALLKILEEPPRNAVIILTTSKPEMLPPTVAGRCQRIYFPPLEDAVIEEHLKHHPPDHVQRGKPEEIQLASRFSQGSYSRAKELLESGIKESRETMLSFLIAVLRPDYAEVVRICREESGHRNKDRIKYFLMQLGVWFRDLLWMKNVGASDVIANKDIETRLSRFITNYPKLDFYNIILSIEEAERMIFENVQAQLVLIDLAFKLRGCMGLDEKSLK